MSEQDYRRMAEEAFQAINAHDLDRYIRNLDSSYVWESELLTSPARGPQEARTALETHLKAFPDLHFDVEQITVAGSQVITQWQLTGTQKGEFAGIAPTNKTVRMQGCSVTEIKNGKLARTRTYSDNASLFQQLGALKIGKTMTARS